MGWLLLIVLIAAIAGVAVVAKRSADRKELERKAAELEPVKKLAYEDITALGVELQDLDEDMGGRDLDKGARADYQRALDAYESAKLAGVWSTSGKLTASGEQVQITGADPAEIKGWMTINDVITAYQVPKEQFYAQFQIPADLPIATPLKDIEPLVPDFSVTTVRDWLAARAAP